MGGSFDTEVERCCSGKSGKEGVGDKIFEEGKVVKEEVDIVEQVEVVEVGEELGYRVGGRQGEGVGRFLLAAKTFQPGETVLAETPLIQVIFTS